MKLTYKFAVWYLLITLGVLIIGGVISFYNIKHEIDQEQARYLKHRIDFIAREIQRGIPVDSLSNHKIEIRLLNVADPEIQLTVTDTMIWHDYMKRKESEVKVSASRKINGQHYFISTHDSMVESDDITEAVLKSLTWIFIIFLIVAGLLSFLISKNLLAPFHKTLLAIQSFRLRQKHGLNLPQTRTKEFKKLNAFLKQMTKKAKNDYQTLKEFTENASHELQTPLAIIRGKLELLLDTPIDEHQAKLIISAHDSVEKLSKMNQSLTLLTKLDNQEFEAELINFSDLLKSSLFAFQELIEMKQLKLEQKIEEDVMLNLHPTLAAILINNLLSNAIRHNRQDGRININLNRKKLVISNTGDPLDGSPADMFIRFKKSNQSNDSIGLGLSIVKQICKQNNISIQYEYEDGKHIFTLLF